jgi:hypothetical protein
MARIKVKAAKPETGEVALWEVHKDHPGGEVFVAGDKVVEVAETPEALKKLAAGVIVKADDGEPNQRPASPPADNAAESKPKPGKK